MCVPWQTWHVAMNILFLADGQTNADDFVYFQARVRSTDVRSTNVRS